MDLILNSEQSKLVDVIAVENFGYNPIQLMEIASYNIFLNSIELIKKYNIRKIILFCGSGNNGGDGFAAAKHFSKLMDESNFSNLKNFDGVNINEITIYHIGKIEKMSSETKTNYEIWQNIVKSNENCNYNYISKIEDIDDNNYIKIVSNTIIFECLVGVGIKSILNEITSKLINKINHLSDKNLNTSSFSNIIKIAIDNPAGINVDNGNIIQDVITKKFSTYFIADYTFTMFSYKTGMVLKSSKKDNYYGEIKVCDIGFYQEQFINFNRNIPNLQTQNLSHKLNYNDFRKILPLRDNITSKFSFGKVAILAGCKEMSGAGVITANSAITMGGGLVYLITDIDSNDTKLYPEVIKNEINFNELNLLSQFEIDKVADNIIEKYKNVNTWIIGPGIGTEKGILNLVTLLVEKLLKLNKFVVLDADGLKVINIEKQYTKNLILTPHLYEYTKLAKLDLEFVQKSLEENPIEFVNNFSKKLNCVIHLKYFPSITTFGNETYLNNNYNSGLSKAGSGDMLSGLVGSLISQTKYKENSQSNDIAEDSVTHIVALASALQSYLADTYTQKYNKESMRASDLIELIKELH